MLPKYQVFVSSTYDDLRAEREQVIRAILEMGHIPVGMEMFSAADEEQWKLIARQIDETDYYVVIVAHRYGSVAEGISYTEKEYNYAVAKGVPVLGFIIDDAAPWPATSIDQDQELVEALRAFKVKVRKKPVGFWTSADDLHGKFAIALMKLMTASPRVGWVRSSEAPGADVITELSRLSRENAVLRTQMRELDQTTRDEAVAAREETLRILRLNKKDLSIMYKVADDWCEPVPTTLYWLFYLIAPEMVIEKSIADTAAYLARQFHDEQKHPGEAPLWVPKNYLKGWRTDFMTLGLVVPSERRHPVADKNEYWTLTEEGQKTLTLMRRKQLEFADPVPATPGTAIQPPDGSQEP